MAELHQKQARSQQTYSLLLENAMEVLSGDSPENLRIPEICRECATNSASAYYHFGSKEGLVTKAYVELFRQSSEPDIAGLELLAEIATSGTEVISLFLGSITNPATSEERKKNRNIRSRVYAAALTNTELAKELVVIQDKYLTRATGAVETLQQKGLANKALSARQSAVLLESLFVSRSTNDTHLTPESDESWAQIIVEVLQRFLIN